MDKQKVEKSLKKGTAGGAVPPLLPALLAACAPAAELQLAVPATEGAKFLAMSHGSGAIGAGPQLSTFWADLTDLKLGIYCTLDGAHDLGTLSTLTALRELSIAADAPLSMRADMSDDDDNSELRPYIEVALNVHAIKLPAKSSGD
ncbi:g781 [Coccomyxa viridis]|uniref:G781 protein n=1 Tax=Coccomyxa viridis TaxID=1274662 RepID=A0ABP1FGI5_9CHLO